jgi:hypothetical protein
LLGDNSNSLNTVIDANDRGDDVQRRFHYQHAYAAIQSLNLLEDEAEFTELYCEHFEDILMKRRDSKYAGLQVKTRNLGQTPFKTSDTAIKKTLKRFFKLERNYGTDFYRYAFITNGGFWHEKENHNNLPHLINKISDCENSSILDDSDFNKIIEIANGLDGVDAETVFSTLKKFEIETGPGLDDVVTHLASLLSGYSELSDKSYPDLLELAKRLISKTAEASSLTYSSSEHDYFILSENPNLAANAEILEGKRITREKITTIIQDFTSEEAPLRTFDPLDISYFPKGTRKLEIKMSAGEISLSNINLVKDYKYSAEAMFQKMLYKNQPSKAKEVFDGLSLIVRTECQEAYDANHINDESFGQNMLSDVRPRIRRRYEQDCQHRFNGTYEHLMGIAGILTEECVVWWSNSFEIPGVDE